MNYFSDVDGETGLSKIVKHCLRKGAAGLVLESRSAQYELVAPGSAASQQSRIFCRDPPPSPPSPYPGLGHAASSSKKHRL